jgi:hypothetical protein
MTRPVCRHCGVEILPHRRAIRLCAMCSALADFSLWVSFFDAARKRAEQLKIGRRGTE